MRGLGGQRLAGGLGQAGHHGRLHQTGGDRDHADLRGGELAGRPQVAGGGGGYGDPRARAVDRVLRDVRDGYVTEAVAREVYGVAIDTATWTVDEPETARLRGG